MTRFTDSPFEYMMTQKPQQGRHPDTMPLPLPPEHDTHPCFECSYSSGGRPCVGYCLKELQQSLTKPEKGENQRDKNK